MQYSAWVAFSQAVSPGCEFFKLYCRLGFSTYTNSFSHFASSSVWAEEKQKPSPEQQPPVIFLVLDSISRSSSIRWLPKVRQLLQERFQAVDFQRHFKVGQNSPHQATAFLAGM